MVWPVPRNCIKKADLISNKTILMMEIKKIPSTLLSHHGSHHIMELGFNSVRLKKQAQILKDSTHLFTDSLETTITKDNGKTDTKEKFQKTSTLRTSTTLILSPEMFYKTTPPRALPMTASLMANSSSLRTNQSNSLKKLLRPIWEWKVLTKPISWKRNSMKLGSIMMSIKMVCWMQIGPLHSWDTFARVRKTLISNDQ